MRYLRVACFIGLLVSSTTSSAADLVSTFNSSKENWRTSGDAKPISWKKQGGNPDGYIEVTDIGDGKTWYFVSPTAWSGNWTKYKKLSFDLKQIGDGSGFIDKDLVIIGQNGKKLTWNGEREPAAHWISYTLSLDPVTFKTTQANYDAIITSVNRIMIRGEFISGPDTGGLDNVVLSESPAEIKGTVNGFGVYSIVCKNVTTQQVITLSSNVKLDWNCEKSGLIINDEDSILITIEGNAPK